MKTGDHVLDLEYLAALHERGVRDADHACLIEGVRFIAAAIDTEATLRGLVVCPPLLRQHPAGRSIARELRSAGTPTLEVSADDFTRLSILEEPQGIAAVIDQRWFSLPPPGSARGGLWLAFDQVRSPGNLGTVARTAQAARARGLVFLSGATDPYAPRALRASMGSLLHLDLIRCQPEVLARWKRKTGALVVGTSSQAAVDFRTVGYHGLTVLVFGCERGGLSDAQRDLCDRLVRIPMRGGIDSLNLAAAASVLLYEAYGQRNPVQRPRRSHVAGQGRHG